MSEQAQRFSVLKVSVHLLKDYSSWLIQRLEEKKGTHVITLNAEMAMLADKNPAVADVIQKAELVIPDGAGVVFYLKMRSQQVKRCPGIELAESLLLEIGSSYPLCFYGGEPGVAEAAAQMWRQKIDTISIITNHGYLSQEEQQKWLLTLQEKQPRLILVALGVPRQELWIKENRYLCPESVWIGVGGSFDIWAGTKTRAPRWFCDNNLEWLYRLYQEPWRWQRMMALPKFFWRSLIS